MFSGFVQSCFEILLHLSGSIPATPFLCRGGRHRCHHHHVLFARRHYVGRRCCAFCKSGVGVCFMFSSFVQSCFEILLHLSGSIPATPFPCRGGRHRCHEPSPSICSSPLCWQMLLHLLQEWSRCLQSGEDT